MRLLCLVLMITCLTGAVAARPPIVTGQLLNLSANQVNELIVKYVMSSPFTELQVVKSLKIRPDGSFSFQLEDDLPYRQILFQIKDLLNIYIYANTELFLEVDMTKLQASQASDQQEKAVRFLGTDGPLNNWLRKYRNYQKSAQDSLSARASDLEMQPQTDSTLAGYKEVFVSLKFIQDRYIAANPSPYSWVLGDERLAYYYDLLIGNYMFRAMDASHWQEITAYKSFLMSEAGLSFCKHLAIYVSALPDARKPGGWKELLDRNIRRLDSLFPPEKADFLKLFLGAGLNLSDEEEAYTHIRGSIHTAACLALLDNHQQHLKARLSEIDQELSAAPAGMQDSGFGRPLIRTTFGASLYDASGMKAEKFLSKLKNSFPGKALIIDRWATWCVQCIAEMPSSKDLQEESASLPVVFVYLCSTNHSTELKWKQKVADLEQPGVHILIDEPLDKELTAYFSFTGYPGYALIDQTGQYRRGAITFIGMIRGRDALQALIK